MTRMRFPRVIVALLLALSFGAGSVPLDAAKGSRGSGRSTTKSTPRPKTARVKEYTRKDGTTVKAHDRAAPKSKSTSTPKPAKVKPYTPLRTSAVAVARDERGRIQRSEAARHAFARRTGYPNGRPGYIIDHIAPLACGGADAPSNMQWQTVEQAKAKDRVERGGCR